MPPHEKRFVFAVWCSCMEDAVLLINYTTCAHLLKQIVPDSTMKHGLWLLFEDDSLVKQKVYEYFPKPTVILNKEKIK